MYLAGGLTSYFKILQWLLLTGTTFSICSNSSDSDLKWIVPATHPNNGNLMLLVGEWWEIDCRVNDDKVNVTLWQREIWRAPFENQRDADGENINMKDKNVFRLAKLKLSDQGRYFCKACGMKKYAGGIYVNQGVPFATPSITKTPNTDLLPYGSAVTLKCNVEGSYADYEIKWFKIISFREKKLLLSQDASSVGEDNTKKVQREVLKIDKLTEKDNGSYLCQVRRFAVDHIADNSVDIIVEVSRKPSLLTTNNTKQIFGEGVQLDCVLEKDSPGNVNFSWYSCDSEEQKLCTEENRWQALSKMNLEVQMFKRKSSLKIYGQNKTGMTYRCSASNEMGMTDLTWKIVPSKVCSSSAGSTLNLEQPDQEKEQVAYKTDQVAAWRFATVCMSCLLLIALILVYRERKARMKNNLAIQSQKPMVTKV